MRTLPQQNEILVVREVHVPLSFNEYPILSVELHTIPINDPDPDEHIDADNALETDDDTASTVCSDVVEKDRGPGHQTKVKLEHWSRAGDNFYTFLDQQRYGDVIITEHGAIHHHIEQNVRRDPLRLQPISVFVVTVSAKATEDSSGLPAGLVRLTLFPKRVNKPRPSHLASHLPFPEPFSSTQLQPLPYHYRYDIADDTDKWVTLAPKGVKWRVIPGSHRTLLHAVPDNLCPNVAYTPDILGIYKYHPLDLAYQAPWDRHAFHTSASGRTEISKLPIVLDQTGSNAIQAIAWDESVGRLAFAPLRTRSSCISVIDFAKAPRQGT